MYNYVYMYSIYLCNRWISNNDDVFIIQVLTLLCVILITLGFITENEIAIMVSNIINVLSALFIDMKLDSGIRVTFYIVGYFVHSVFFYVSMPILCCISLVSFIISITVIYPKKESHSNSLSESSFRSL